MKYICPNCYKEYSKKINYDYHFPLCKLHISKDNNDIEKNESLSNLDIQIILKKLLKKNLDLEERVKRLEAENIKLIKHNDKIINKEEFLNENIQLKINFIDYIESLKIDESYLNYLFENDLYKTYNYIISNIFDSNNIDIPVKSFKKQNKIYIFQEKWIIMNDEYYNKLIYKIHQKLIGLFIEWNKINRDKILNDDNFAIKASENQLKLCAKGKNITELFIPYNSKINKMFIKIDFQDFYSSLTSRE